MAGHTNCLLDIFEDLDNSEFGKFKWQLRMEGSVKKSILDDADRMKTVDAMVGTYDDQVLEVTRRILEKIKRIDLIKKIPGSGSGYNGPAATVSVPTEGAKKLRSVRTDFIAGMSQANLHGLLDKLLDRDVLNDAEMDDIRMERLNADKARRIIDTVRGKGDGPSSDMIAIIRLLDPNLCEKIGL